MINPYSYLRITGDTHGQFQHIEAFCERIKPSAKDTLIILGDAGFNYYSDWRDIHAKNKMSRLPITIFAIHGNHEQRPSIIPSYHTMNWRSGQVYVEKEYPNILFAADGEVYDLDGRKALVIGGAYSVDKQRRLTFGWHWWADEQPSDEIKRKTEEALEAHDWKMDIVLSHTGPLKYEPIEAFLPMVDQRTVDKSTEIWLDRIEDRLDYQHWYFGHYHTEKEIDKISILFQSIQPLP